MASRITPVLQNGGLGQIALKICPQHKSRGLKKEYYLVANT